MMKFVLAGKIPISALVKRSLCQFLFMRKNMLSLSVTVVFLSVTLSFGHVSLLCTYTPCNWKVFSFNFSTCRSVILVSRGFELWGSGICVIQVAEGWSSDSSLYFQRGAQCFYLTNFVLRQHKKNESYSSPPILSFWLRGTKIYASQVVSLNTEDVGCIFCLTCTLQISLEYFTLLE